MSNEKIKVVDNALTPFDYLKIRDVIMGPDFPWFFRNTVVHTNDQEIWDTETYQFVHLFYNDGISSHHYDIVRPILDILNAQTVLKIKANLLTCAKEPEFFVMHQDYRYPTAKSAIFYINTNDGVTQFETGEEIASVANRLVVFDNDLYHTGIRPTDKTSRVLINFNYFNYI